MSSLDVDLEPGDRVITEDLAGENELALVTSLPDETASEYELPIEDSPTILEYWGYQLDPDEAVVNVRFAEITDSGEYVPHGDTYGWPISRLDRVGTGGQSA